METPESPEGVWSGTAFLRECRRYLRGEYLPKITVCVEQLSDADLWWRPDERANAIANLMLHLAGNIRQWVVSGIGGAHDTRTRTQEFDQRGGMGKEQLLERLSTAVTDADRILAGLDPATLGQGRTIQGRTVTVFEAVLHVVEHFAMHTGQITQLTKMRTGRDLGFYRDAGGLAIPTLPGTLSED